VLDLVDGAHSADAELGEKSEAIGDDGPDPGVTEDDQRQSAVEVEPTFWAVAEPVLCDASAAGAGLGGWFTVSGACGFGLVSWASGFDQDYLLPVERSCPALKQAELQAMCMRSIFLLIGRLASSPKFSSIGRLASSPKFWSIGRLASSPNFLLIGRLASSPDSLNELPRSSAQRSL
jgi:hypothetical protein